MKHRTFLVVENDGKREATVTCRDCDFKTSSWNWRNKLDPIASTLMVNRLHRALDR